MNLRVAATALLLAAALALAGCAGTTRRAMTEPATPATDGPPAVIPEKLAQVPDAEPRIEPIRLGGANKPYEALGERYVPLTQDVPFRQRGLVSWYGRKFHGKRTASGEPYDMFAMTGAHPTLPLPSYVRVRNPANNAEVVLRINDRGPFHSSRIMDLSYTAALKLGVLNGVTTVELERITFEDIRTGAWRRPGAVVVTAAAAAVAVEPVVARAGFDTSARTEGKGTEGKGMDGDGTEAARMKRKGSEGEGEAEGMGAGATKGTGTEADGTKGEATERVQSQGGGGPERRRAAETLIPPALMPPIFTPSTLTPPGLNPPTPTPSILTPSTVRPEVSKDLPQPAPTPTPTPAPGFWVQLGAFQQRAGAEGFHRRVAADVHWLAPLLAVFAEQQVFRLQAGPYASRDEAQGIAQRVREALKLVPVVLERR